MDFRSVSLRPTTWTINAKWRLVIDFRLDRTDAWLKETDHSITNRATHRHQVLTILTKVHALNLKKHFYHSVWSTDVTGARYLGIVASLIRWWDKCRRKRKFEDQNSKLLSCCDVRPADVQSLGSRVHAMRGAWCVVRMSLHPRPRYECREAHASPHGSL